RFSGSPRKDAGPVTERTAPILICADAWCAAPTRARSPTAVATVKVGKALMDLPVTIETSPIKTYRRTQIHSLSSSREPPPRLCLGLFADIWPDNPFAPPNVCFRDNADFASRLTQLSSHDCLRVRR